MNTDQLCHFNNKHKVHPDRHMTAEHRHHVRMNRKLREDLRRDFEHRRNKTGPHAPWSLLDSNGPPSPPPEPTE